MNDYEIGYALSKQVPAMREEVTLHTSYGDLVLSGRSAERVAAVVERILREHWQWWQSSAGEPDTVD